ncbi:MAG: tripartite tricarboxylate transporter substrate binding protein [Proteobacteria bacterium]|nr:tripartite tricarboxylate transporter substrate binding protein [Pseudomonadota bacterium]
MNLLLLAGAGEAAAQAWPQRPIRIIVGFAAGGNTDSIARLSAEWLRPRLDQNVLVDNRPGANGAIGAEAVMRAAPDGYTLLMAALPQLAILPAMTKTPYDPVADFAPVTVVGSNDFALAINDKLPATTLPELVAYVKARPGEIAYASGGSGTVAHLTTALFLQRAGLTMLHVPYRGGALALADLVSGQVPFYFGNLAEVLPHAAMLKILAVSGARRVAALPAVPTIAEQGYPGFHTATWNGLVAPAATPRDIVERLAAAMRPAAQDAEFVAKLARIGVDPVGNTPEDFAQLLRADLVTWAEAVRVSGAKVD